MSKSQAAAAAEAASRLAAQPSVDPSAPSGAPAPETALEAWKRFLRADWLLNSITQNFVEPLVQFDSLPSRLAEVERDLAEGRIPRERLRIVEEELRAAQLWFADVSAALADADRSMRRLLTLVWERRKASGRGDPGA
jgi:hypothetical protein